VAVIPDFILITASGYYPFYAPPYGDGQLYPAALRLWYNNRKVAVIPDFILITASGYYPFYAPPYGDGQ
jgi:hypothetical protein